MIQLDVPLQHQRAWGALGSRETAGLAAQPQTHSHRHTVTAVYGRTNTQSVCRHMLTTTRRHTTGLETVKAMGQLCTGIQPYSKKWRIFPTSNTFKGFYNTHPIFLHVCIKVTWFSVQGECSCRCTITKITCFRHCQTQIDIIMSDNIMERSPRGNKMFFFAYRCLLWCVTESCLRRSLILKAQARCDLLQEKGDEEYCLLCWSIERERKRLERERKYSIKIPLFAL